LAILVLGACLRGAYLSNLRTDPFFAAPALDAELHDYWARGLAFGSWSVPPDRTDPRIRTTPFFRPPGYPYLLAAEYRLTAGKAVAARVVQFGIGLGGVLLGFALARRLGGTAAGLVCAALMATSWTLIFFEGELLDSFVLAVLTPGVILLALAAARAGTLGRALLAGLGIGVFALVRPNALALIPTMAAWLFWARRRREPEASAWKGAVALVAGAVLAVAPATLRNHAVSGEWIPISANAGINLYIGNNPRADGVHAGIPDVERLAGIRGWTCFDYPLVVEGLAREVGRSLRYGEASRIWAERGRGWIVEHPGRFLALTAKRLALFLGPAEAGDRDLDLTRAASPVLRHLPGRFPWYLAAAVVGLGWALAERRSASRDPARRELERERFEARTLLVVVGVVYLVTFLPFFFNARYRIPLLVILFVLGSDTVVRAVRLANGRHVRPLVAGLGAFILVSGLASINWAGYHADPGEWHYQRGNAYRDAGHPEDAAREYRLALDASPRAVDPRRDLALVLREQGRPAEAVALLRSALAVDPQAVEARFDLAQTLAAGGRFQEAATEFEHVLAEAPRHAHAHLSFGTTLLQLGRDGEAMEHYSRAEDLAPNDPLVAFVVGRALISKGRTSEGIVRLRRAVQLAPGFDAARRALASAGG
jgi:Tfp pilus assembly protein PilF/4-amino-4-deoxy-L-arabinose transferase-like glycosyltransferase